jgi:hypothetical protein
MLARYGIQDMLSGAKFWRFLVLVGTVVLSSLGGFRSMFILLALTFLFVFYFEGLFRTKYFGIFLGVLVLGSALLIPFANRLPLSIQRSISVLPLRVDPIARIEAEASTEWRVRMWEMLLPEVPHYLWLGKGLAVSGASLEFSGDLVRRGQMSSQETAILAGTYHNGPFTVIIPFGIWGAVGWLWFLIASFRALHLNYRYGPAYLRKINTFFLAYFVARVSVFLTVYGDFRSEFAMFTGLIGLNIALNGGICRRQRAAVPATQAASETPELALNGLPAHAHRAAS